MNQTGHFNPTKRNVWAGRAFGTEPPDFFDLCAWWKKGIAGWSWLHQLMKRVLLCSVRNVLLCFDNPCLLSISQSWLVQNYVAARLRAPPLWPNQVLTHCWSTEVGRHGTFINHTGSMPRPLPFFSSHCCMDRMLQSLQYSGEILWLSKMCMLFMLFCYKPVLISAFDL